MANKCSDYQVKGCPASYYLTCRAFVEGKNCWEVPGVPCCAKSAHPECQDCQVFKQAMLLPDRS
jgi:hypothetical protein